MQRAARATRPELHIMRWSVRQGQGVEVTEGERVAPPGIGGVGGELYKSPTWYSFRGAGGDEGGGGGWLDSPDMVVMGISPVINPALPPPTHPSLSTPHCSHSLMHAYTRVFSFSSSLFVSGLFFYPALSRSLAVSVFHLGMTR